MRIPESIKNRLIYFSPTKEELILTLSFLAFFPFPMYFVAGWGLMPPLYTAIAVIAFVAPALSGLGLTLLLLYISFVPLVVYALVVALNKRVKDKKWLYALAGVLIILSLLANIYYIADTGGERHFYTAIKLYGELF